MKFVLLTKKNEEDWNNFVNQHPEASIFHTLKWKNVLEKNYNFKACYYLLYKKTSLIGILPLIHVKNFRSNKLVSLPASMLGGPLLNDPKDLKRIIKFLQNTKIDFQIFTKYFISLKKDVANIDYYIDPNLKNSFKEIYQKTKSINYSIKKTSKLNIEFGHSKELKILKEFYQLFIEARKKQRIFAPSYKSITRMEGDVFYCKYKNKMIAGTLCLEYKNNLYSVYHSSNIEGKKLCANDYLFYKLINFCIENCLYFHMGGCQDTPEQKGLMNFKKKWGALKYTEYVYSNNEDILNFNRIKKNGIKLIPLIPNFIFKKIGNYIIRHFY